MASNSTPAPDAMVGPVVMAAARKRIAGPKARPPAKVKANQEAIADLAEALGTHPVDVVKSAVQTWADDNEVEVEFPQAEEESAEAAPPTGPPAGGY